MKFEIGDRVRFLAPSTLRKKVKNKADKPRIEFAKENPIVTIEEIEDGDYGIEEDEGMWLWGEGWFKEKVNEPKFKEGDVVQFYPLDVLKEKFGNTEVDWDAEFTDLGFNSQMWGCLHTYPSVTIRHVHTSPEPCYSIEEDEGIWMWPECLFEKVVSKPKVKPKSKLDKESQEWMNAPMGSEESDPTGKQVGEPGAKLDKGKPKASLLRHFSRALLKIAEVGTFGVDVKGYARGGWQDVENGIERYDDAKWRHLLKESIEFADEDCDVGHMAQEAWNTLARLELILREQEKGNNDETL